MPNIFNKPPTKWNGMDLAQFNMLADDRDERGSKRSPGGGCGCLTASVAVLAVLLLLLI